MKARTNQRASAPQDPLGPGESRGLHARSARGRTRIAEACTCVVVGLYLSMLPVAQAAGQNAAANVPSLPDMPVTMASNGAVHLTIAATGMSGGASSGGAAQASRGPNCSGPVAEHTSVTIPVGKSAMVDVREPVRSRTVGNPSIVQAMLVSPQTLYLLGSDVGATNMIVQGRSGSCTIIDVSVGADPGGLQQTLAALMPEETGIQVKTAADTLVLTGTVTDAVKAERVMELARAFVARPTTALQGGAQMGSGPLPIGAAPRAMGVPAPAPALGGGSGERIINMMHVAAPQQVMLEVKVAEVSKTLIDQLGVAANIQGGIGSWSFGLLANYLSGGLSALTASKANNLPLNLAVDAQKTDQLVKILAEPNLMAISGQEASFLAGGKVYIPVPQSNGAGGTTIVLQEEQYGVGLTFTPTVLEGGRINLKVSPEVSELSSTGVVVTAGNSNTTSILPLITTRRASTTLQVFDGQSFAIGGLLKSNVTGSIKGLPGAAELPVLGALFRSTSYEQDKTELVFVVTPRLAKPLPQHYPLPTDGFSDANEGNVYLTGHMEGTKRAAPAAGAMAPVAPNSPNAPSTPAAPDTPAAISQTPVVTTPVATPATSTHPLPPTQPKPGQDDRTPAPVAATTPARSSTATAGGASQLLTAVKPDPAHDAALVSQASAAGADSHAAR
ncbi:Type 3 secretion system secretin [Paraburkholderia nemoris]|uniref:type II and III secretion system protein family protein n=1 Tax=Paraburkholderia nemoris TaxID=2793076 RepID=UPI001B0034A7|nr:MULTISPECIES: type II and III secretion system protein family protein [Paraburkholderia]CAE6688303.1 Type 3 secretion system secretin [Paraburkholderia nemoris]CAE6955362.1 Type 3 secretion system secretin [Paraburkholderia nemoris]